MRELISPLASVEVLDAQHGERVIIPASYTRHIFHRDYQDLMRLRRISTSGGFAGTIEYNSLGIIHLATTKPAPQNVQTIFQQYSLAGVYMRDMSALFAEQPVGFDAIVVGDPIRGIIPAPIISSCRFSTFLSSYMEENLFPEKYRYEFELPQSIRNFKDITGETLHTYYGSISLQTAYDEQGNLYVIPYLSVVGQEIDMFVVTQSLRGSYLLAAPLQTDVVRIMSGGRFVMRDELFSAALNNTRIMLRDKVTVLSEHPAVIKYRIFPTDRRYNPATATWGDPPSPNKEYAEWTLGSFIAQSPPIPIPDYTFMFLIQLNTPLDQRYHLYSMSSVARVFFGNHYMLEFVPSAGGVGKVRFYFFPYGFSVSQNVWYGYEPPVNSAITTYGTSIAAMGLQQEYLLKFLEPKPNGNQYFAPYVFVKEVSEMDVWSLSKITPGATAEGFMVTVLKGHVCVLRYSDIQNAITTGNPVRPILAFNPVEYIHRNFGNTSEGVTLLEYFRGQVIPANTRVGMALYNCSAYISFCDLAWRGASISTKPVMLAPALTPVDNFVSPEEGASSESNYFVYLPYKLVGTSDGRKVVAPKEIPVYGHDITTMPLLTPITGTPPTVTLEEPERYLIYAVLHQAYKGTAHPDFAPLAAGTPVVEVCNETIQSTQGGVPPVSAVSLRITIPSSACVTVQCRTRTLGGIFIVDDNGNIIIPLSSTVRLGGVIPSTDLGISPSYFPNDEAWANAWRSLITAQASLLYEVKMFSGRYVPSPPVLLAVDLIRAAVFTPGDYQWLNSIDLGALESELGGTTSVIKSINVNMVSEPGGSTAQVVVEIPYDIEPIFTPDQNLIISLPPLLRRMLRPYNLIRIRLGYTLMTENQFVPTLSPVIFEGVITNVGAAVAAEGEGGARVLRVTISASDLFQRAALSTTEHEPPIDGWFLPEVVEYQMVNSGILPNRLLSNLWFPLGATASYLIGDNLFVGGAEAYVLYSDYPFHYDIGLKSLVDSPRHQIQSGVRRLDVIKQALRLSGAELIYTPYPIAQPQVNSFLDFVLRALPYEKFSVRVKQALSSAKLPYVSSAGFPPREMLYAQVLPVGSYATRPTWVFTVQQIAIPSIDEMPTTPALLHLPVLLPAQPYVHGIFSLQWENTAWALPTLINVEGERIRGQPFYLTLYDLYHELYNPNTIAFKGFRVSSNVQRNPNIVDPLQAFLAAMREYLRVGYFPPIKATLTLFGMPILGVKHLVAISPALRIFGAEDFIITDPTGGLTFWVVNNITYDWSAESPYPRMTVSLTPPHRFLVGLFGLG